MPAFFRLNRSRHSRQRPRMAPRRSCGNTRVTLIAAIAGASALIKLRQLGLGGGAGSHWDPIGMHCERMAARLTWPRPTPNV